VNLSGKTVVITGGSSGIGLATAKAFAAKGAHVALVARDPARLAAAKTAVEGARSESTRVVTHAADV
jgi:NAD(P)-dependent dehydrogenase (short-subunit alcohol dehydrogenase family)